ncbi:hypothetical protein GEMRC1_002527 [Eukaryota sp. GEM-RC1]
MTQKIRDILFLVAFLAVVASNVFISRYAFQNGNSRLLYVPIDSQGLVCGVDYTDRPVLFFPNPSDFSNSLCIFSCPEVEGTEDWGYDGHPLDLYPTRNVFGRYFVHKSLTGIQGSSSTLLYTAALSLFISFIFLILLRFFAPLLVYLSLTLVFLLGLFFSIKLSYDASRNSATSEQTYSSYFAWAALAVYLLVLFFLRKSIRLSVSVIKEASHALSNLPSLCIAPLLAFSLVLITVYFGIHSVANLYSTGEFSYEDGKRSFEFDFKQQYILSYHLFFFIWLIFLTFAVFTAAVASVVSDWYNGHPIASFAWFARLGRVSVFNLGSLAIGALLLALLAPLRFFAKILMSRLHPMGLQGRNGFLSRAVFCVLKMVEKIVKFLNRYIYVLIGIGNFSFGEAASKALSLLLANLKRSTVLTFLTDFVLLLIKLSVGVFYAGIVMISVDDDSLSGHEAVVIVSFILGFLIASLVTFVFSVIIETVFMSFLLEEEASQFVLSQRSTHFKEVLNEIQPSAPVM